MGPLAACEGTKYDDGGRAVNVDLGKKEEENMKNKENKSKNKVRISSARL